MYFIEISKGSLISETWVLTSALCLTGARSVIVILGAHNLSQSESTQQRITSTVFRIHPNWNPTNLQNDVALIRLPYAATLNGKYSFIRFIQLVILQIVFYI